ncbi:MAG: hypothetical protein ACRDG3_11475 [Tepidiformaceae bacterium]
MSRSIPLLLAALLFVIGSAGFIVVTLGDMSVPTPAPLAAVPPLTRISSDAPLQTAPPQRVEAPAATPTFGSPLEAATEAVQALAASHGVVDALPPPTATPTEAPVQPRPPTVAPPTPTATPTAPLTPSSLPPPASVPSAVGSSGSSGSGTTPTATPTPIPTKTAGAGGGTMSYSGGTGVQGQPNVGGARRQPTQQLPASD